MKFFNLFSTPANSPAIEKLADKSLSNKAKSLVVGGETGTQDTEPSLPDGGGWTYGGGNYLGGDKERPIKSN